MQHIVAYLQEHLEEFSRESVQRLRALNLPTYAPYTDDQVYHAVMYPGLKAYLADLAAGTTTIVAEHFHRIGIVRAQQGGRIGDVYHAIKVAFQTMNDHVLDVIGDDKETHLVWYDRTVNLVHSADAALGDAFAEGREQIIGEQSRLIEEISTPIIPIHHGILVLPVIGTIDERRAGALLEGLLEGITTLGGDVVILDITGVPVVDTGVANHLIQAARAARLLGAQVLLVGISPEIAQTLVQLGVDLTQIDTRADLRSGVEEALRMRGLTIVPISRVR